MRFSFFYGYVILALCFTNMVFMRGISVSFGVFYVALLEEFPWSHKLIASIASVNAMIYALTSPLIGWAFDRLGPRILMPLAGTLIGAGLFLSGLSNSFWQLYIFYGILAAMGQAGLGFVSHNALISRWFVRRRGTAIGLATMGLGLGVLIIVPLTQILISRWGWRSAFMFLGALVLFATVPANAILQRRSPKEVGQLPDGDTAPPVDHPGPQPKRPRGAHEWTLRSASRSFPFWGITIGHLALGTGLFMIYTHLVVYLVDQGFDKLVAAFILGLIGFMRIGGTVLWGFVSDRLGRDKAYGIATLIALAGVACLIGIGSSSPPWFVYTFAILYGIGHSAGNPTYGALIGDIFGGSKVGTIFGFLEISFGLGMAFGAWLGGYAYDLTGSYRWPFSLGFVTFTISYFAVHFSLAWHLRKSGKL